MRSPACLARRLLASSAATLNPALRASSILSRDPTLTILSRPYSSCPRSTTFTVDVKQHTPTRGRARAKPRSQSQSQSQSQCQTTTTIHAQRAAGVRPSLIARKPSSVNADSTAISGNGDSNGKGRKRPARSRSNAGTNTSAEALLRKAGLKSSGPGSGSGSTVISIELPNPYTSPTFGRITTMMVPKVPSPNSFQPVMCYPKSAAYHSAITPAHMPLPLNLDSNIYWPRIPPPTSTYNIDSTIDSSSSTSSTLNSSSVPSSTTTTTNPFAPSRPSPTPKLLRKSRNALGDHHTVIAALGHPLDAAHLGQPGLTYLQSQAQAQNRSRSKVEYDQDDHEITLARQLGEASVKWRISNEMAWEGVLDTLGMNGEVSASASASASELTPRPQAEPQHQQLTAEIVIGNSTGDESADASQILKDPLRQTQEAVAASASQNRGSVDQAVDNLNALLAKLDTQDENELRVHMDSVKRKRKKKMSKHKYQKRRKATRAQRKRLGK